MNVDQMTHDELKAEVTRLRGLVGEDEPMRRAAPWRWPEKGDIDRITVDDVVNSWIDRDTMTPEQHTIENRRRWREHQHQIDEQFGHAGAEHPDYDADWDAAHAEEEERGNE